MRASLGRRLPSPGDNGENEGDDSTTAAKSDMRVCGAAPSTVYLDTVSSS